MHELSLAMDLVDRAIEKLHLESDPKVKKISVIIGPNSGVDSEAFAFAFPEAARGTALEGVLLEVLHGKDREFLFESIEVFV